MTKEEKIYKYADENNLIAGIGTAEDFEEMRNFPVVPFVEIDIEKRVSPSLTVENAKSIICVGLFYNKTYVGKKDNKLRGKISVGAIGEDYHSILKKHLENIMEYAEIKGKCFSDTGPLSDRAVAMRCGLGFVGKNRSIINEKFGSFFFIGYIITPLKLKSSTYKYGKKCGECSKCIKACPTGALSEDGFDYKKCISYITQAKELNSSQMKNMGMNIYGCDMCQKSCIFNTKEPENVYSIEEIYPCIENIISMSNSEFKGKFGSTAAGWRGKKILQRNALISAINSNHIDKEKIINMCKNDEREQIKKVLKWAGIQED